MFKAVRALLLVVLVCGLFCSAKGLSAETRRQTAPVPDNFIGTINGKYPILMTLMRTGSELTGRYRYTNKTTWLVLRGTISKAGLVALKEFDAKGNQTGLFRGRWEGKTFAGQWMKPDGSRMSPFTVQIGKSDFSGKWSWSLTQDGREYTFDLDLKQIGKRLTGSHTATARNGARVDTTQTPDGTHPSIKGTITGNTANVTFISGYNEDAGGKARMTLSGDRLDWKILSSHGEHYFPQKATLKRLKMGKTQE